MHASSQLCHKSGFRVRMAPLRAFPRPVRQSLQVTCALLLVHLCLRGIDSDCAASAAYLASFCTPVVRLCEVCHCSLWGRCSWGSSGSARTAYLLDWQCCVCSAASPTSVHPRPNSLPLGAIVFAVLLSVPLLLLLLPMSYVECFPVFRVN